MLHSDQAKRNMNSQPKAVYFTFSQPKKSHGYWVDYEDYHGGEKTFNIRGDVDI